MASNPATIKQINFAKRLLSELDVDMDEATGAKVMTLLEPIAEQVQVLLTDQAGTLTTRQASYLIDQLLRASHIVKDDARREQVNGTRTLTPEQVAEQAKIQRLRVILNSLRNGTWTYADSFIRQYESKGSLSPRQWAVLDNILVENEVPVDHVAEALGEAPDGRFAWPSVSGSNDYTFVHVGTRDKGEKDERRYVNLVVGGQGDVEVPEHQQVTLAKHVASLTDDERRQATVDFGRIGVCGFCGRSLTVRDSRFNQYGSTCALKYGLDYATAPADWVDPGFQGHDHDGE